MERNRETVMESLRPRKQEKVTRKRKKTKMRTKRRDCGMTEEKEGEEGD